MMIGKNNLQIHNKIKILITKIKRGTKIFRNKENKKINTQSGKIINLKEDLFKSINSEYNPDINKSQFKSTNKTVGKIHTIEIKKNFFSNSTI